ncbi:nuclear envelope integral membrane protein 2 isoform X3 [Tiliqua scincoides]|uniref:nuclear envelope integral membrane protein 2 isoform X3 n=1 Tax=Tiliqua scincoides TaxID=71010 RepID=UPI0034633077
MVKINSTEVFKVVVISEESNCQNAETLLAFLKCLINNIWQSGVSNETFIAMDQYGDKKCFQVHPTSKQSYTVNAQQNMLDGKCILFFIAGGLLFHFAHNLSRSIVFYYCAGVTFGVLATLVFLLLMLKRFIPKLSTFWILMSGCWFSSLYLLYTWKDYLIHLWYHYTRYILGYILIVGFTSFGICYKHGPLNSERSMNLFMWTLQLIGLILVYFGIAIPPVAYAVIGILLCSKILHYPLRIFHSLGRKASNIFRTKQVEVGYLTADEYQEQGERETVKALEELRTFCRSSNFPSWVAVVKLQSPQKFANFVLGLSHVSPEEVKAHEEQYGLGGALLEQQVFNEETESEPDQQTRPLQDEGNNEEAQTQHPNNLHFRSSEFL